MSNLKEVSTQRLCTDWTQPMMWLQSTTVSVTIKSQPVNHCRPFTVPACQVWFAIYYYCFLFNLNRSDSPQQAICWLLLDCSKSEEETKTELCAPSTSELWCNIIREPWGICWMSKVDKHGCICSFHNTEFLGNIKIKHKHLKSSILNVDCYSETKDICWHENPNLLPTTAQVTF